MDKPKKNPYYCKYCDAHNAAQEFMGTSKEGRFFYYCLFCKKEWSRKPRLTAKQKALADYIDSGTISWRNTVKEMIKKAKKKRSEALMEDAVKYVRRHPKRIKFLSKSLLRILKINS